MEEPWYVRKARLAQQRNPQKHPVQLEIGVDMDRYEVFVRNNDNDNTWSMFFQADDFSHAEEQATDTIESNGDHDEIVVIRKSDNVVKL